MNFTGLNERAIALLTNAKERESLDAVDLRLLAWLCERAGLEDAAPLAFTVAALCRACGLPFAPLLHGLREYQGQPHRVELVTSIIGVDFYDDSKGTNVGATVAALVGLGKAFGSEENKIVVILGGDGKGQEFEPLAEPVSRYVRAVTLIGRDADRRVGHARIAVGVMMRRARDERRAREAGQQSPHARNCTSRAIGAKGDGCPQQLRARPASSSARHRAPSRWSA